MLQQEQKQVGIIDPKFKPSDSNHESMDYSELPELLPLDSAQERTRKFSVFNAAGRMLNHLLLFGSRSSMPPDLRSPSTGGAMGPVPRSDSHTGHHEHGHYSDNFSFKNVFKKRSVWWFENCRYAFAQFFAHINYVLHHETIPIF